jgi:Domain of unknown function (DUF1330)
MRHQWQLQPSATQAAGLGQARVFADIAVADGQQACFRRYQERRCADCLLPSRSPKQRWKFIDKRLSECFSALRPKRSQSSIGRGPYVVVEYPSLEKVTAAYSSAAYREAFKAPGDSAVRDFRIVEGVE